MVSGAMNAAPTNARNTVPAIVEVGRRLLEEALATVPGAVKRLSGCVLLSRQATLDGRGAGAFFALRSERPPAMVPHHRSCRSSPTFSRRMPDHRKRRADGGPATQRLRGRLCTRQRYRYALATALGQAVALRSAPLGAQRCAPTAALGCRFACWLAPAVVRGSRNPRGPYTRAGCRLRPLRNQDPC